MDDTSTPDIPAIKNYKHAMYGAAVLTLVLATTYISFQQYQPKAVTKLQEVKGLATPAIDSFPLPADANKLSTNTAGNWKQTTFTTNKTPTETQDFYRTVFTDKGWELDSEKIDTGYISKRYKQGKSQATVTASINGTQKNTVASLEFKLAIPSK